MWNTTKDPIGTGKACPGLSAKSCPATEACPSNCIGQWNKTSECKSEHVSGFRMGMKYNKQYKYVYKILEPKVGTGIACSNSDGDTKWIGSIVTSNARKC